MKNNKLSKIAQKKIRKFGISLQKGDMVIDDRGEVYKVGKVTKKGVDLLCRWEGKSTWDDYSTIEWDKFKNDDEGPAEYMKVNKTIEQLRDETFEKLKKFNINEGEENKTPEISTETALTTGASKEVMIAMKKDALMKTQEFEIMKRTLEAYESHLQSLVSNLYEKVAKVQKVLDVVQLYLGINEEILMIQDGTLALANEPICFRQHILFMDEEVGDPTDKGLDFRKIGEFDAWLVKDKNYIKLIPENKGVVVIKPRRRDKDYGGWYENAVYNAENKKTYILIRNGEAIYRIWSENLQVHDKLFPQQDEIKELLEEIEKSGSHHDKDKAKDLQFDYRKNALMMQGLIDRADVFKPMAKYVNIFKPETYMKGEIKFIYDDLVLTSGRKLWEEWHDEINSKIKRGSRIYCCSDKSSDWRKKDYVPAHDVYIIEDIIEKESRYEKGKTKWFRFKHNPGGDVYSNWGYEWHERKNRVSCYITGKEEYVLNYDMISLEDVVDFNSLNGKSVVHFL